MFGSFPGELIFGLALLVIAVIFWRYLLYAYRRQPPPALLRSDMAAQLSTVLEIALLTFGLATVIDAAVKMIP